jgi:leucyl/phenylalanyl-tRNA--protein transferase
MKRELAPAFLLNAYASGVFPMSDEQGRISWYAPDPRAIIELDEFHVPRTLRSACRQNRFKIAVDRDFRRVIRGCAAREEGTWISEDMEEAYIRLHDMGLAHSVECYVGDELGGGLYGVALGGAFFGESMFHRVRDASKVALVFLVERLRERGYKLLDVQFLTEHLARFGAKEIPRNEYIVRLKVALKVSCTFAG